MRKAQIQSTEGKLKQKLKELSILITLSANII